MKDMKKMSLERIFNWLNGKTLDRAMSVLLLLLVGMSTSVWGQSYHNGTWYSYYDDTQSHEMSTTADYSISTGIFAPTNGKLTFTWKYTWLDWFGTLRNNDTHILESSNGGSSTSDKGKLTNSNKNYTETTTINISADINWLKWNRPAGNTHKVTVSAIKLPMATHIRLKTTSTKNNANLYGIVDQTFEAFADTYWGTTCASSQTVKLRSFLTTNSDDKITITSSNPTIFRVGTADNTGNKIFTVGKNKFACESSSSVSGALSVQDYSFKVYFCPPGVENYSADITISNGSNSAVVHVSGKGIKRDQTIQNFPTTAVTHNTTDVIEDFAAYTTDNTNNAKNNLAIEYSSDKPAVATVNKTTGAVTIIKDGIVTFTAKQTGNSYYNSTSKSVTWTINKVTPTVTWPVIDDGLVYTPGAKVQDHWTVGSAVDDKGNAVAGTFACTEELQPAKNSTGYTVTFSPTKTNWYNSTSVIIKKDVAKADQTITWNLLDGTNPKGKYYEYATGEAFGATASSGIAVTYSSSDDAVATIVDGNKLNVVKANELVTITATCVDPAGNWNDAPAVTKTFKTCGAKPDNWNVTASGLTYGQLLSESALSGDVRLGAVVVAGTLEWVEASTLPNAGNHNYSVLFTPENEDAYGSVTFDVPVTVAKADPVITWNISERLRENSRYSNFVVSTNTEAALNTSVSNTSLLSVDGTVLTTGDVESAQSGWIKVSQPASTNYNAVPEQTLSVTVNPKSVVCLPFTLQTESDYNNVVVAENKSAWCNTNEEGHRDNYIAWFDVRYTQRVGIALGTWEDGLDGISWAKLGTLISGGGFAWSSKSVDLSFTGVPDKISFDVESQSVTSTPPDATWTASATDWYLYESADGVNYTQVGDKFVSGHQVRNRQLKEETRYVRIKYSGNFTGFVKNLQITQKKYLKTAQTSGLTFGNDQWPLQEPQELTISYSSLGSCEIQNGAITVSSDNPAFYADVETITDNVGIDQMGEYAIRVRCNDVNKSGHIIFTAFDGTKLEVPVRSLNTTITSATANTFQTGSEHAPETGTGYHALQTIDFSSCFRNGKADFDTLYIYGVTAFGTEKTWEYDVQKGYNVPAFTITDGTTKGTAYTPCFVYAKNGNDYKYIRTYDATNAMLKINADGKKVWFSGYRPVSSTAVKPAIAIIGTADVYLSNTTINACGTVLFADNGTVTLHARGNNDLNVTGEGSAIALAANSQTDFVVEDSWQTEASGKLSPNGSAGLPTIDLGSATNSVTVNGTQLTLKNGHRMAVAYLKDGVEQVGGSVRINDGTILGEAELGLPVSTTIDGGTFNDGSVRVYGHLNGSGSLPRNSAGDVLARQTLAPDATLPAGYGHAHIMQDANAKIHPMLKNEDIFIYTTEGSWTTGGNWNKNDLPTESDIVIVRENVTINTEVTVASLTIESTGSITIEDGGVLTIAAGGFDQFDLPQYGDMTIKNGALFIPNNSKFEVQDFVIEAAVGDNTHAAKSGQVLNSQNLVVDGEAYFDLTLDQSGACSPGWYDFAVPFPVSTTSGVSRWENGVLNNSLKIETNYAIMNHSEAVRSTGNYPWKKYHGIMQPNESYTITIDNVYPVYRFRKVAGAAINTNKVISVQATAGAAETDRGWNGLGNGSLAISDLAESSDFKVQLYDHTDNAYSTHRAGDVRFAVGAAFFVQASSNGTVTLQESANSNKALRAQSREPRIVEEFKVSFAATDGSQAADNLYISASEDALSEYEIGHDLVKLGTMKEAKIGQLWCTAYNMQLCDAELPLNDNQADFPISMYAPVAGTYTLSIGEAPQDATVYLTQDGANIWNLSFSDYEMDLSKGTTTGYGLRIIAEEKVATGVGDMKSEDTMAQKLLINGVLYIQRDGALYDATGKRVQ